MTLYVRFRGHKPGDAACADRQEMGLSANNRPADAGAIAVI